jgi:hypothetical protein
MVRLVFRPYTQVWRSICTSESLRASTRVSPGFALLRHSSPSFGSQHLCSNSNLSPEDIDRPMVQRFTASHQSLSLRSKVYNSPTRIHVRLLGPCFKTGRIRPFRQHHDVTEPKPNLHSFPQSTPWYTRVKVSKPTFYHPGISHGMNSCWHACTHGQQPKLP